MTKYEWCLEMPLRCAKYETEIREVEYLEVSLQTLRLNLIYFFMPYAPISFYVIAIAFDISYLYFSSIQSICVLHIFNAHI